MVDQFNEKIHIKYYYKNVLSNMSLQVSELFGGMEICSINVIVSKDNKEYILKASDCTFNLLGDTQEEDRRSIADIVSARMQVSFNTSLRNLLLKYYIFLECLPTSIAKISIATDC